MRITIGPYKGSPILPLKLTKNSFNLVFNATSKPTTVRLGKRWSELQGVNNWEGLLNPLDATLRSEILRYGEFVNAAYNSFDIDRAICRFPKTSILPLSGLPNSGYRVTRNLYATSGASLPNWAGNLSRRSSWIGYVAICQDEDEIARLGRRDIVISLRGTVTALEWFDNLRATLTHLPGNNATASERNPPMVERGFWSLFTSAGTKHHSLRDEIRSEVSRLLYTYGGKRAAPALSLTVTGHSLGAALAVLIAHDITSHFREAPLVTVMSFGGPRVGNASFRRQMERSGSKVLRIVNTEDIVTKIPGFVVDEESEQDCVEGLKPKWWLSKTGWVYADIGRELRVSSMGCANMAECHDLNVYLNLVNQLNPLSRITSKEMRLPVAMVG